MSRLLLIALALLSFQITRAQFEYTEWACPNFISKIFYDQDNYFVYDEFHRSLSVVNKQSEAISYYHMSTGYPMQQSVGIYQLDSFLVVVNVEPNDVRRELDGYLNFNMKTMESWLDTLDYSPYYGPQTNFFTTVACSDNDYVYTVTPSLFTHYELVKYHPLTGKDSTEYHVLPNSGMESILQIAVGDSLFCAYTNEDRFIVWDKNDENNFDTIDFNRPYVKYLRQFNNRFYFIGSDSYSENDSIYYIDSTLTIHNFSAAYPINNYAATTEFQFSGDTLAYRQNDHLYLLDTSTLVTSMFSANTLNIPEYGIYSWEFENGNLLIGSGLTSEIEFRNTFFQLDQSGNLDSLATTLGPNVVHNFSYEAAVNSIGDLIVVDMDNYVILNDGVYTKSAFDHPYFSEPYINLSGPNHSVLTYSDDKGNVYGYLHFNYNAWYPQYADTNLYLKVDANKQIEFITEADYEAVLFQTKADYSQGELKIVEGELKYYESGALVTDYDNPAADSLVRVFVHQEEIYVASYDNLYMFDFYNQSFELMEQFSGALYNGVNLFSYDKLGNVYFRYGYGDDLYRIAFQDKQIEHLALPYTGGTTNHLYHDAEGNLYSRSADDTSAINGYDGIIFFHNGFEWRYENQINNNTSQGKGLYTVQTSSYGNQVYLYSMGSRSILEVDCPIRELDEVAAVYEIYDSTDVVNVGVDNDMEHVLWFDGSTSNEVSLNVPGTYWVKTAAANGCSRFKEFQVELKPTVNNNSEEIFYYFEANHFPLIFEDGLEGDFKMYDLKGSLVKDFPDYQNDWVPPKSFQGSIMLFGIYDGQTLVKSGRIIFI